MTTPKVVKPESTSKSRFFDSIESKNQFFAPFEKFVSTERKRPTGGGNTKESWKESHANNIALVNPFDYNAMHCVVCNAGSKTKFAPVKSLRFSELFSGILLSEFHFTVFFGVES